MVAVLVGVAVGCSGDAPSTLRSGPLTSLLGSLSLDSTRYCALAAPTEEAEGGLAGAVERAGITLQYRGPKPDPLHSSLHFSLDRLPSDDAALRARAAARSTEKAGLSDARDAGSLPGWPGSTIYRRDFVDYTGVHRSAFAAVVVIDAVVVRLASLGVPEVDTLARFRALASSVLSGLVGSAEVAPITVCSG